MVNIPTHKTYKKRGIITRKEMFCSSIHLQTMKDNQRKKLRGGIQTI